jgi:hypothetical protein
VFVGADTSAVIKMPAARTSGLSAVKIAFSPDQGLYPGATTAPTSRAVFVYSDLV